MEDIGSSFDAQNVKADGLSVVLHADNHWLKSIRSGSIEFFSKLTKRLTREGITTRLVNASARSSAVLLAQAQDHIHIMIGANALNRHNILHTAPSCIWGFWHLDETGINWNLSLRLASFVPKNINSNEAELFFNGMTGFMLRTDQGKGA